MPQAPIPTKTPLGQEALRRRTGELGQRHRTILFLIDGRRTLAEVLGLAHQAGAATTHFEDLVRLGYVQLPPEAPPEPATAAGLPEAAQPPAEGQITALELEVPGARPAPEAAPDAGPEPLPELPPIYADTVPEPAPAMLEPLPPPPAPPPPPAAPPPVPAPAPRAAAAPRAAPRRAAPPPALVDEEAPLLERARACLLETLRVDSQPSGNRIAERARQAGSTAEMIEVVWLLERGLKHSQRSHRGLLNLQKARELLGLGNTLVDEDSRPGIPDDDDW